MMRRFALTSGSIVFLVTAFLASAGNPFPIWGAEKDEPKPETDPKVLREKLVGSWKIVSASFDGKPSELHRTSVTIKHITPVHIIWIGYQPEAREIFRSSGGSWTIQDGRYVETMRYGIGEKFRESSFGKSYGFDCRFEGDKWIQSGKMPNGVFLEEIWQRVQENEDVAAWPISDGSK
jgi:hypothetical protein